MSNELHQLLEEPYHELFNQLKAIIYKHVTDTEPNFGQYREAVIYQIDHGIGHLNRVSQNMAVLLRAAQKELHPADRFAAMCAAAFHDIGMHFGWELLDPEIKEPLSDEHSEIIRDLHAEIGGHWFRSICSSSPPDILYYDLTGRQIDMLKSDRLNRRISFAIETHGLCETELEAKLFEQIDDTKERSLIEFLTCALTIADTLDMDSQRVSNARMEAAKRFWKGKDSIIQPDIKDLSRFLMVHYFGSAKLQLVQNSSMVEFITQPKMPDKMLDDPDYKKFRDYLLEQYRKRLRPSNSYHQRIIKDYAGIDFVSIDVPNFSYEPDQFFIEKDILKKIMTVLNIIDPIDNIQLNVPNDQACKSNEKFGVASQKEPYDEILQLRILTTDNFEAPSTLLRPEFQTVPFHSVREGQLQEIIQWAENEESLYSTEVRLLIGAGGSGKTRLMLEGCNRLKKKGWIAGFLPHGKLSKNTKLLKKLTLEPINALIVLDYAESRREELVKVLMEAVGISVNRRFCVVLLARGAGDWWDGRADKLKEYPEVEAVLRSSATSGPYLLTAKTLNSDDRKKIFYEAQYAFAKKLNKTTTTIQPPDLLDDHFDQLLYIHMTALASLREEKVSLAADDLLDLTLSHERDYWEKCGKEAGFDVHMIDGISQVVLQLTLAGGTDSSKDAKIVIRHTPQSRDWTAQQRIELFNLLRRLYSNDGGGISSLEPDLLGEHLVAMELKRDNEPLDIALIEASKESEVLHALTVLNRLAARRKDQENWIEYGLERCLISEFAIVRAEQAIQVALASGDPIGKILARVVEEKKLPKVVNHIFKRNLIPINTVALLELALVVSKERYIRLKNKGHLKGFKKIHDYAESCHVYGMRLTETSKIEDGMVLYDEALHFMESIRHLAEEAESNYLSSLSGKAEILMKIGDNENALNIFYEVLNNRRILVEKNHGWDFKLDLISGLINYGIALNSNGRWKEAADQYRQSLDILDNKNYIGCEENRIYLTALTKKKLSLSLLYLNKLKESAELLVESLVGLQYLSTVNRDAYQQFLADAHFRVSMLFLSIENTSLAEKQNKEHQKIVHFLFQSRPNVFMGNYIWSQLLTTEIFIEQGNLSSIYKISSEILPLAQENLEKNPESGKQAMAHVYHVHATALLNEQDSSLALFTIEKAIELREQLNAKIPIVYGADLAIDLELFARCLYSDGQQNKAKDSIKKSFETLKYYHSTNPILYYRQMRRVAKSYKLIMEKDIPNLEIELMEQTKCNPERLKLQEMEDEDLFQSKMKK
ncbi:MAG: tetratricopeptide repeat protein [Magnetococcales bacterium]|nr:tetratricopeptide repeat protein [Magnetococcales bacterium]